MVQGIHANRAATNPQIIIVKENRESLISRGIGSAFSDIAFNITAAGMLGGAAAGAINAQSYTGVALGALIGGAVFGTISTVAVATIQLGADALVNSTLYVLKLPYKAVVVLAGKINSKPGESPDLVLEVAEKPQAASLIENKA